MASNITRHDILLLFDVVNGNPNGDPDAGNMPRFDPTSNCGLVSDVCLKRKVRNFFALFPPKRKDENSNAFNILIQQGNILNVIIKDGIQKATGKMEGKGKQEKAESAKNWLCREFFDIRTFGAVLSTGDDILKGSAYGQVRGPVQFTFGKSIDPVIPLEISITRCAVTKEEDAKKERTMGNKHIIPYALYSAKAFVSPLFADQTGFDQEDLLLFFEALKHLFTHDQSAARSEMNVRGIYDFEHIGTQKNGNVEINRREARLGCAHAHQLFEKIKPQLKEKGKSPTGFEDYQIHDGWKVKGDQEVVPGVRLNRMLDPNP